MTRGLAVTWLALVLAACAPAEPESPRTLRASAAFTGPEAEVIEVLIYEIPPGTVIQQVVLIGPKGEVIAARDFTRSNAESGPGVVSGPSIGIGVTVGSSTGVNPSLSLGWQVSGGGPGRQSRRVAALIPLPDPAAYRASTEPWRVEVRHLDVTGAPQVLSLSAPRVGR